MIISLSSLFKRLIVTIMMMVGIFVSTNLNAQESKLDFSYTVDSIRDNGIIKYEVIVKVTKGIPPYSISILEDMKEKGFSLVEKKDNLYLREVKFILSERKRYIIVLDDNNESFLKRLSLIKK